MKYPKPDIQCHQMSLNVTKCHKMSPNVIKCHLVSYPETIYAKRGLPENGGPFFVGQALFLFTTFGSYGQCFKELLCICGRGAMLRPL